MPSHTNTLDPVGALGAEHNDKAAMGIKTQLVLSHSGKAVMTLAKVYRLCRNHNPDILASDNHEIITPAEGQ